MDHLNGGIHQPIKNVGTLVQIGKFAHDPVDNIQILIFCHQLIIQFLQAVFAFHLLAEDDAR